MYMTDISHLRKNKLEKMIKQLLTTILVLFILVQRLV